MNYQSALLNPVEKLFQDQQKLYANVLILTDTVPANSSKKSTLHVSGFGHFMVQRIKGVFETISGSPIVDDGICHLSGKLTDNSLNRDLFEGYIPLDMILTPGRIKTVKDTNYLDNSKSPAPKNLFYPMEFRYLFGINSDIGFDVKNNSNVDTTYTIIFEGYRVKK